MRDGRDSHFDPELLDLFFGAFDRVLAAKDALADAGCGPPEDGVHRIGGLPPPGLLHVRFSGAGAWP